jgi:hypothetical protein
VQLWTTDGRQLREAGASNGRLTLDKLSPGSYRVVFVDTEGKPYPAEARVRLFEAGELDLEVRLDVAGVVGNME